jgi:hypothetical protein
MEKEIAKALALELSKDASLADRELRFHDMKYVYVIKYERVPCESELDRGMYVSAGPAGEACPCCGGSGKRTDEGGSGSVAIG